MNRPITTDQARSAGRVRHVRHALRRHRHSSRLCSDEFPLHRPSFSAETSQCTTVLFQNVGEFVQGHVRTWNGAERRSLATIIAQTMELKVGFSGGSYLSEQLEDRSSSTSLSK